MNDLVTDNTPFGPEDMARRKKRALVMALILIGLVALFFITTLVRLGGSVAERAF
jgi:accessory gene regulator protein AgrB